MNKAEELRQELLQYAETAQPNEFPIICLLDLQLQKTSKIIETLSTTEINAMYRVVYRLIGKDFSKYKNEEYHKRCENKL